MKNRRKLRNYFLDKRFQLGHAGAMVFIQILVGLAVALAASWFYLIFLNNRLVCDHNSSAIWHLGGAILFMILFVTGWSIRFTHAITGPVYKMGKVLNAAAAGAIPQKDVYFRKGDKLQPLENGLNKCLRCMREHQQEKERIVSLLESTTKMLRKEELSNHECADFMQSIIIQIKKK